MDHTFDRSFALATHSHLHSPAEHMRWLSWSGRRCAWIVPLLWLFGRIIPCSRTC